MNDADDALRRLSSALGLGEDPQAILAPIRDVYRIVDDRVRERSHACGLPCRSGCAGCCHESVFLSAPEFLAVAEELFRTRLLHERRRVVDEMREIAAIFEDELEMLLSIGPGPERNEVAARVKFRCPLLDAEGRCSVYGAREMNARTFGLTWDASFDAPYGCELTRERLRVLPDSAGRALYDARAARRLLSEAVPGTELVHVYPWWFANFGDLLLAK